MGRRPEPHHEGPAAPRGVGRHRAGTAGGSWTGSRYRWMPADVWFGPDQPELPGAADARAELVRRWLAAFGPATLEDLRWWTGWTLGATRQAVAAVDTDRGRPRRRRDRPGARRRHRVRTARRALGGAASGARPHGHGMEGARLVRRGPHGCVVRSQREHRSHDLVRRADRRRVGAAQGRHGRAPSPRGHRARGRRTRSTQPRRASPRGSVPHA